MNRTAPPDSRTTWPAWLIMELYDELRSTRLAQLALYVDQVVRRDALVTVGAVLAAVAHPRTASRPGDVVRAIRRLVAFGALELDERHRHAGLVGMPFGMFDEQGRVPIRVVDPWPPQNVVRLELAA